MSQQDLDYQPMAFHIFILNLFFPLLPSQLLPPQKKSQAPQPPPQKFRLQKIFIPIPLPLYLDRKSKHLKILYICVYVVVLITTTLFFLILTTVSFTAQVGSQQQIQQEEQTWNLAQTLHGHMFGVIILPKTQHALQMFLSINQHVCEKKTKSVHIFTTVSLDRHHYIHLFYNLALLEHKKYKKEITIEEEKSEFTTNTVYSELNLTPVRLSFTRTMSMHW